MRARRFCAQHRPLLTPFDRIGKHGPANIWQTEFRDSRTELEAKDEAGSDIRA